MPRRIRIALAALVAVTALAATDAHAQITGSLGVGIVHPMGDFGDNLDRGFTARGQVGLSLLLASVHAQVGLNHFPGKDVANVTGSSANIYHAGVGGRLGLGLIFVGANANYFFGDGENGVGYVPEVGIGLLKLEVVADARIDGDAKWVGLRAGLRF